MRTHWTCLFCLAPYAVGCVRDQPTGADSSHIEHDYRVGTWNLEYLNDNHARGFPEYLFGGPVYDPRVDGDYAAIADRIVQLDFAILVLEEINAQTSGGTPRSVELDRLVGHLGPDYRYAVGESGHPQHVAILWDTRMARADTIFDIRYDEILLDGEDLFARDPLVAKFTLLEDGATLGDVVVVGLHLASGRANTRNHDRALALLVDTLYALVDAPSGMLAGAQDILIAGDLNFDFFDADRERFVEELELGAWDVLADWEYPRTRLGGVPLVPEARLDYLICTDVMAGAGGFIRQPVATVHAELASGGLDAYRRVFSDHFPISVLVRADAD